MIIGDLGKQGTIIDSVTAVNTHLFKEHHIDTKDWIVRSIMKNELDMKYKKIKAVSIHANSYKNLVCRQ